MSVAAIRERADSLGINIRETVILGNRALGLASNGELYQWIRDRWVKLTPVYTKPPRERNA